MPNELLPEFINGHDIVVSASLIENFGVTILEGMFCGKPIVSTRYCGPDDTVNDQVGVLVPVKDSTALAAGIEYIIENYESYDPIKIREYAVNNFS